MLSHKCRLIVVARSKEPLEKLQEKWPENVSPLVGDFNDLSLGSKAVDLALKTWNRLDGLIINHGVLNPVKRVANVEAKEWQEAFNINLFSAVALVKAALPELRKAEGRIIMTSSGAAANAYSTWGAYGAAKAALNHLVLTLSVEEPSVTTVAIRPGTVDTEMQREIRELHLEAMDEHDAKKFSSLKSEGTLLRPDQPGNVIAELVLDASRELSGKFLSWNDDSLAKHQS